MAMRTCAYMGADMNGDGVQTITDIALFARGIFLLPGNLAIEAIKGWPTVATFLEVGPGSCNGWISTIVAMGAWAWLWAVVASWLRERSEAFQKKSRREWLDSPQRHKEFDQWLEDVERRKKVRDNEH